MEPKKNPDKDIYRHTLKFFLLGLIISVAISITAFEWRSKKEEILVCSFDQPMEILLDTKSIPHEPAPAPPTVKPISTKTIPSENIPMRFIESDKIPEDMDDSVRTESFIPDAAGLPNEASDDILLFPEVRPIPIGGYEAFYKFIGKTLKYPRIAQRSHVEGKVFIEFVIDRNGSVTQLKIIKGIGSGCDDEAMRVLALTQWDPGKQRGKPVMVRMTIPINFVMD